MLLPPLLPPALTVAVVGKGRWGHEAGAAARREVVLQR
jgi:hypothetical protein